MSVQLAAQDFATPDKAGPTSGLKQGTSFPHSSKNYASVTPSEVGSSGAVRSSITSNTKDSSRPAGVAVTPHNNSTMATASGKHVHFGAAEDEMKDSDSTNSSSSGSSSSKRGLVSRRGGRYVSPGRPPVTTGNSSAPFREEKSADGVPGLSATNSVGIVSLPSESEKDAKDGEEATPQRRSEAERVTKKADKDVRPCTVSCASSQVATSPLSSKKSCSPSKGGGPSFNDTESKTLVRSPVPSSTADQVKKTPPKFPSRFHTLPALEDPKLQSPVGFIMSPSPGTPSYKAMRDSFEGETKDEEMEEDPVDEKVRDYTQEKFALTPTNFSTDYGKTSNTKFDTSSVLNWLTSPNANHLLSPGGGLGSCMNTPKGPLLPRTPGTPTVCTSFFFSDVANLPRSTDTPRRGEDGKSPKKGLSNIICISPLASSRNRGASNSARSPINYNDIFASPNPLLEDSPLPTKGLAKRSLNGKQSSRKEPNLDAVHLAERDLMQDEDLSVLLQLAGGNTPRGPASSGKATSENVFRASGSRKGDDPNDRENLPGLQLPVIGDREGDSGAARLARKSQSRDHAENDSYVKPSIGIRKSSSGVTDDYQPEDISSGSFDHPGRALVKRDAQTKGMHGSKSTSGIHPYPAHSSHPFPPRPPSQEMYPGYPPSIGPHGMRASGRMSVVVGGPPPSNRTSKPSPAPRPAMSTAPRRRPSYTSQDSYPPPSMAYPPPHAHHYPPPHPVHMGMGAHPYHGHYASAPPPRHHAPPPARMPLYSGPHHHPGPASMAPHKKGKPVSMKIPPRPTLAKRPSIGSDSGKAHKKVKKVAGGKQKKNKSPQLVDKGDRQRAAQTIAAVNIASGGKNDKAAALAAAILRGVTMRPSGKWQAQLYFAGKSRYIGVFDTREKAALAYEIAREKLKSEKSAADGALTPKQTENAVNAARKAAFDGVNEKDPRLTGK